MKSRKRQPFIPPERQETARKAIVSVLDDRSPLTAREISAEVHLPEKEVFEHLTHIRRSLHGHDRELEVTPPVCLKCGFAFRKRDRLSRPGKCPVCRSEHISDPLFSVRHKRGEQRDRE